MKFPELKIKIKSLAAEAVIIRSAERKALQSCRYLRRNNPSDVGGIANDHSEYERLRNHRVLDVRQESRAAQIALAYLLGKPYAAIETPPKTHVRDWRDRRRFTPVFTRAIDLIVKYGPHDGAASKDRRQAIHTALTAWFEPVPAQKAA